MRNLALAFFALSFVFPLGLYPFQDTLRGLLVYSAVVVLFLVASFTANRIVSLPRSVFVYVLFSLLWTASYFQYEGVIDISYNIYLFSIVFCVLLAISAATMVEGWGKERITCSFAYFVVITSVIALILGLLRYYGVLRHLVPLISEDGDRLMGPMGQPNLMGLLMAMALSASIYLRMVSKFSSTILFWATLAFIVYAGYLTGSRSFLVAEFIVLVVFACYLYGDKSGGNICFRKKHYFGLIFLVVFARLGTPLVDGMISGPLIELGYINRIDAISMLDHRAFKGGEGRLSEWVKVVEYNDLIENVWMGNGVGSYGSFSNEASLLNDDVKSNGSIWNHPHNIFIMFFVEFGILGLLFLFFSFLYVSLLVFYNRKKPSECFLSSVILIFVFHSLVEFSLWYLPYLALFVIALTILDKKIVVKVSTKWVPRAVAMAVFFVFLGISIYVWRDVYRVLYVMYSSGVDNHDKRILDDASRSSIVGDGALSVSIFKFSPSPIGVDSQLERVEEYVNWRPTPLYMLRYSTLTAATGDADRACAMIERSVFLFPAEVEPLQRELNYLRSVGLVKADFLHCILSGVKHWTR